MARVDLLLEKQTRQNIRRVGDLRTDAPYIQMFCDGEVAFLPMASTVVSANQALWDQKDFTADSLRGAAAIAGIEKWDTGAIEVIKTAGGGFLEGMKKDLASSVGSAVGGIDGLGDFILHKAGKSVNPNKEMTFNGIGYRSFTFDFDLIPLDQKQADSIQEFIEFFQEKAMPDFAGPDKIYWKYPSSWDILFSPGLKLPKIMPCYLTDYSIDYGGAGKMVFHKSGDSVQTNISLTFTEADLHTKSKVQAFPG